MVAIFISNQVILSWVGVDAFVKDGFLNKLKDGPL